MPVADAKFLHRSEAPELAYAFEQGAGPLVVWLGGFKSDMAGTKAEAIAVWASARGQSFLRFDYTGHGQSRGDFIDFTIGQARQDVLDILAAIAPKGDLLLIGSSMGGWMALQMVSAYLAPAGEQGGVAWWAHIGGFKRPDRLGPQPPRVQ